MKGQKGIMKFFKWNLIRGRDNSSIANRRLERESGAGFPVSPTADFARLSSLVCCGATGKSREPSLTVQFSQKPGGASVLASRNPNDLPGQRLAGSLAPPNPTTSQAADTNVCSTTPGSAVLFFGLAISLLVAVAMAPAAQTNLAVVVRHAPALNGNGSIEGSLEQLLGESVTINGGFVLTGDLLVSGTPTLRLNGHPTFAGTVAGNGSASPAGYSVILNGNCSLQYLRSRTTPVSLPTVASPPPPAGTRNVTINTAGQSIGKSGTLRNLTLNGNVGQVAVPPGNYGAFIANGGSGFTFGVAGATQPTIYNLQSLTLNGRSRLDISGPIILTVANGFTANGVIGTTNHSSWLQLQIASGGFTLNGGCMVHGNVTAPAGTVIVNGNSCLIGSAWCDRLIVNGGGIIRACIAPNHPPVAKPQTLTTFENTPVVVTLTGKDADGDALTFRVVGQPAHGTLNPQPSTVDQFSYTPVTNYYGNDTFSFVANDGKTDSAPALVSISVAHVNQPPHLTVPDAQTADENSLLVFDANRLIQVADADAGAGLLQLSLSVSNGTLAWGNTNGLIWMTGTNGSTSSVVRGTLDNLNAGLVNLAYLGLPDFFGTDLLTLAVDDLGNTGAGGNLADNGSVPITVVPLESGDFAVDAGEDQVICLPHSASLAGAIEFPTSVVGTKTNFLWSKAAGPGDVQFSSHDRMFTTAQFSQPGTYVLKLRVTCGSGARSDTLTVDVLPPAPDRLAAARSNRGHDFWLMFLPNMEFAGELPYVGCDLIISSDADTVGEVQYQAWDAPQEIRFQITAGGSTNLTLWNYPPRGWDPSDTIIRNGIHVIADQRVTVHGLSYEPASTDGYLALPTSMLGTNYMVLSYRNSPAWYDPSVVIGGTEFGIVAAQDVTHVTITPAVDAGTRRAGQPYEIVLQRAETYRLINEADPEADFTGTTITSDQPVAVFAGHRATLIPPGYAAADHLIEQMPPLNQWGREFAAMPLATRVKGDTFRFLAQTNGTRVAVNGQVVATLDRGQFYETILDVPAQILSSRPILVAQYANGSDYDGGGGDPFMMLIPPFEQFGGDYILATAPLIWNRWAGEFENLFANYLNLVVRTNGIGLISLDGVAVPASQFQVITDTGYAGAQLPVDIGAHHLSAPVPFGACVYGAAWYESYALMGGVYSETVDSDTKLKLEQPTSFAPVGGEKVVTARVTDGRGRPLMDIGVDFCVAGSNSASGRIVTSRFGEATFSYTGTNAGVDVITATLVELAQSVTNTWLGRENNTPPVVSAAATQPEQFGLTAQLAGTVSDDGRPAGAGLNVRWFLLDGPADAQFEDPTNLSTRACCTQPGRYLFELTADDSQFSGRSVASVTVVRPFTVDLSGPEPGAWFSSNSTFAFAALVNMVEGAYTNIEFYDADLKLSEGLATDLALDGLPPGQHSITAVVTEEHGFQVRSQPIEFFVTAPPVIESILPDADLTLPYGASTATFKALAWDPDGTITNLAVYVGPILVHQVAADEIDFTGLVDIGDSFYGKYATHPVHFIATDDHGISTEIYTVNVTLVPPQIAVNIISPVENQVVPVGQHVHLLAEASVTPPARIAGVMFYQWEQSLWGWYWQYLNWPMDDAPPYTMEWIAPGSGDYEFSALAWCDVGIYERGPSRHIHVCPPPVPQITLEIVPQGQTNALVGFPLLVAAQISITNVVQITNVEFFADGWSVGALSNAPYLLPCISTNPGLHRLTARATTDCGTAADSDPVYIQCGLRLEVLWEGVRSGEWAPVGTNKTLGVRLIDPGSIFDHIEFLANGAVLDSTRFTFVDWTPTTAGDFRLRARAHDAFGNTYESEEIIVHAGVLHPPQVQFLSPLPAQRFACGQPVSFAVRAIDPDSAVTNLSLFRYSQPEVSSSNDVLECTWTNLAPGRHEFTAVATDDKGLVGQAKVRIAVDAPVIAELSLPQHLAARVLGCNAIRITWDTNFGIPTHLVVVERAEGTNEIWEIAGKAPWQKGALENHFLHAATVYRYRAHTQNADGYRSVDSDVVVARTRDFIPRFAVLDVAENLEDAGAFGVVVADDNKTWFGNPFLPHAKQSLGEEPVRTLELDLPLSGGESWGEGERRSNSMVAAQPGYRPRLVSSSPQQRSGAEIVSLDALFTLGISDFNSVLLAGCLTNYVWSPGGAVGALTDTNFFPFRMTRSGIPVGTRWTQVPVAPLTLVTQLHAGFWADGFVDLTSDPQALRLPMSLPPLSIPYDVFDTVADMNSDGTAVGVATWVWVYSLDGQTSLRSFGPVRRATLWPANNKPPVQFGTLQQLNSISESSFQAINDAGDIVGVSSLYDANLPEAQITHAVRSQVSLAEMTGDKLTDLGTLGGLYSAAISINNAGIAAGYSSVLPEDAITNARAVYWLPTETQPRRLPGYESNLLSYARVIDDQNQIVGEAVDLNGVQQAVLWKPNSNTANGLDYDLVNLNDLARNADWQLASARAINRSGLIVGSGYHLTEVVLEGGSRQFAMAPRVFLLVPDSSLDVDYNRDGRIERNQNDDLPDQQPYQFWINDDSDDSALGNLLGTSDLPGARSGIFEFDGRDPDYADDKVNGVADLIDWFPVYLNISNLLVMLPPSQYEYRLVHAEGALNFLYTDLRPDQAGTYLTNNLTSGFGRDFNQPAATAGGVEQVTADGVALSADFLNRVASDGRGVLLFEARRPTIQPLRLEVRNRGRVVTSLELPLQISGAEAMYGWVNLRPVAGEASERDTDLGPLNWPAWVNEDEAFVFLHGYNVNERQSRAWAAEMFKRLWWSGSLRRFYGVSWNGAETQVASQTTINYHINVCHAFETARVLSYLLTNLLSGQDVTVAAHSLGNMVVCSAIQDCGARPDRYYMVDGAVAMEAFDSGLTNEPFMTHPDWRNYPERLYASDWHQLFPEGDGRRGLTWRGRFQDVPRLTQLYNFYSSGEEVLENRQDDSDPWVTDILSLQFQWPTLRLPVNWLKGRFAWVLQEMLKGRMTSSDIATLYSPGHCIGSLPVYLALQFSGLRNGNLMGSQYGGWGFNAYWDVAGSVVTVDRGESSVLLYLPGGHRQPTESSGIDDADLEANPFFLPFLDSRLTSSEGGGLASEQTVRAQLLAEAIPARTFAVGANKLVNAQEAEIGAASFNMNEKFQKRGWPLERIESPRDQSRWKHSDIHDIPYLYTGMVFDKFVELEGGR
jgi:hypothetical protein